LAALQVAAELAAEADRLMASLSVQRQSFEQQLSDAERLINDTAQQMSRCIENERQRLLRDTNTIKRNTDADLDKV